MTPTPARAGVVVIGTGALGSAAAYWLSRRLGEEVVVVEQFRPGHTLGASEDHSRIIRHSYDHVMYTQLTRAMFDAWAAVEGESGMQLVVHCGGLDIAEPAVEDSLVELDQNAAALDAVGIPYERFDAAELMRRYPQWRVPDDAEALFEPEAGILDIRQACAAHLALARAHGARVLTDTRVERLDATAHGVRVHTSSGVIEARDVAVCAGKWTNHVLGELGPLNLHYMRQQITYFSTPKLRDFAPERFPVWIRTGKPCYYGFPVYGTAAIKVGEDLGGPLCDIEYDESPVDDARIVPVEEFLARCLPTGLGPRAYSRSCVYDLTPDRDFVLDRLPGHEHVHVAVGAGHAAKFGSLVGKILSEQIVDGATELPIDGFRADRPALGTSVLAS